MFKRYRMTWGEDGEPDHSIDFFVNSKAKRNGFLHRACVIGLLPRLDSSATNWGEYQKNDDILFSKRMAKVAYCNRTWEAYGGQMCLLRLWEQLDGLKFLDMSLISKTNPFGGSDEPEHEDLWEPDELFDRFKRR